jgi:hypothetical protein
MKQRKFEEYYDLFLADIEKRDNFKETHKIQLEILCNLYVEMGRLEEFVYKEGYTYASDGRNGYQEKIRPEVAQLNRTRSEIRAYSRMLGLLLVKDGPSARDANEETEWD